MEKIAYIFDCLWGFCLLRITGDSFSIPQVFYIFLRDVIIFQSILIFINAFIGIINRVLCGIFFYYNIVIGF